MNIGINKSTDVIKVLPFQKEWAKFYENERKELEKILSHLKVGIHHYGSTSIEGCYAKPIIDIGLTVDNPKDMEPVAQALAKNGWHVNGLSDDRIYMQVIPGKIGARHVTGDGVTTTHAHIHVRETKVFYDSTVFRDYLRLNPEIVQEYSAIKLKSAEYIKTKFSQGHGLNPDRNLKNREESPLWIYSHGPFGKQEFLSRTLKAAYEYFKIKLNEDLDKATVEEWQNIKTRWSKKWEQEHAEHPN